MLGRAICFTRSTDLNVHLIPKHPHRSTQNNVCPHIWAPHGSVKLRHKIIHHKMNLRLCGKQVHSMVNKSWSQYRAMEFGVKISPFGNVTPKVIPLRERERERERERQTSVAYM